MKHTSTFLLVFMPQYSVPQFVEVEDKIIGPLTLKQFFIMLAGAGIILFFYRLIGNLFFFLLVAIPVGGITLVLTFASFNGRSIVSLAGSVVNFFTEPRSFVFRREVTVAKKALKVSSETKKESAQALTENERLSRLKKLTYILDQDLRAEKDLIRSKFTNLK